jgi:dTDP-4-dehydrorhamnose 3,5-epimerase
MRVTNTSLPDVVLIEAPIFRDERGAFRELFHDGKFQAGGLTLQFVQDNLSRSVQNVIRGLHYQIHQPQGKLVSVIRGAIFDVAVDLRCNSSTFGQWTAAELSDENGRSLYIPPGFAHGFLTLTPQADVLYKCTALYAPEHERTVRWDDPSVAIRWPLTGDPIVSAKDIRGVRFEEAETYS